jgi:hypothetical protein
MKKTAQKITLWMVVFSLGLLAGGTHGQAWAASVDEGSSVTVNVNEVLSIQEQVGDFSLTFENIFEDNNSTGQTVGYILYANNMPNAALPGALSAKLSKVMPGIDIKANLSSGSYTQPGGPSGYARLVPDSTAGIVVGETTTSLMSKPTSGGNDGKILAGRAFINWSATATRILTPDDSHVVRLTVTLKDS